MFPLMLIYCNPVRKLITPCPVILFPGSASCITAFESVYECANQFLANSKSYRESAPSFSITFVNDNGVCAKLAIPRNINNDKINVLISCFIF